MGVAGEGGGCEDLPGDTMTTGEGRGGTGKSSDGMGDSGDGTGEGKNAIGDVISGTYEGVGGPVGIGETGGGSIQYSKIKNGRTGDMKGG
jgi:hypothetical protein